MGVYNERTKFPNVSNFYYFGHYFTNHLRTFFSLINVKNVLYHLHRELPSTVDTFFNKPGDFSESNYEREKQTI